MMSQDNSSDALRRSLEDELGGAYRIDRELVGGAMSRVFVATDSALGRQVVIKVVVNDDESTSGERFQREIQIAARLRHPHIVPLLASGSASGFSYYTMPLVEGQSRCASCSSARDDCRLPRRSARARSSRSTCLRACAGHVHRDIKPENILIDSGHAVVADFGLARSAEAGAGLTRTGIGLGTPLYMSPEQISGGGDVDGRSDLFSLSCVLYEMLTGGPPFAGQDIMAIIAQRFNDPAQLVHAANQMPARLGAVIRRGMATNPADRSQRPSMPRAAAAEEASRSSRRSIWRPVVA